MPMRDHFHSPLIDRFPWNELHGGWPMEMVRHLKTLLPPGFRAAPTAKPGTPFEVDVSAYDERPKSLRDRSAGDSGGTATLTAPAPTLTLTAQFGEEDEYEVRVYGEDATGRTLVAAIELVSPANKDRPDSRAAFAAKCAALLARGVCVSVVDLVTAKHFNLYAELLGRIGRRDPAFEPDPPAVYAVTLRTNYSGRRAKVETWAYPLALGEPLPTVPLWLSPERKIDLNLETSYESACQVLDIA